MPRAGSTMLLFCLSLLAMVGCATQRTVTISTKPADALIEIDGVPRGRGPITEQFSFSNANDLRRVKVSRLGFKDRLEQLTRDVKSELYIELRPQTRRITAQILPAPAIVSIDGKAVQDTPTSAVTQELEFTVDARNNWVPHTITAERPNFVPAQATISWNDPQPIYTLRMEPLRKDLSITTTPPGAQVFLDGELLGVSPLRDVNRAFPVDLDTNEILPKQLKLTKKGYPEVETAISWDEGKTDYHISLEPLKKTVRINTEPSAAVVTLEGKTLPMENGVSVVTLQFPPINEQGELKTYKAEANKKTADAEWYPQPFIVGWDNGKSDYTITLREILTRDVPLLSVKMTRGDDGWEAVPEWQKTIAMKDTTEGSHRESPTRMTHSLPKGTQIGTLTVSPDGSQLLFTVLMGRDKTDFRSQMMVIRTDGTGGADIFSDGKTLDLTPSYTPGGDRIVFASNRFGRRLSICEMAASGAPGITNHTTGDTNDLWPTVDSEPKERLFYQALVDTRSDPRIYMTQIGTTFRTDLTQSGGTQPRVSPKNDMIVFTAVNEKTGNRDLFKLSLRNRVPENITNTPDVDEFDPVWSKDGSRLAYVSDRGMDVEKRRNHDIWVLDLATPDKPMQVTTNGSVDDNPAWDVSGSSLYFRSNRGGEWNIWRVGLR